MWTSPATWRSSPPSASPTAWAARAATCTSRRPTTTGPPPSAPPAARRRTVGSRRATASSSSTASPRSTSPPWTPTRSRSPAASSSSPRVSAKPASSTTSSPRGRRPRSAGAPTRKEPFVSSPPREPRFERGERKPVTLLKLAEKRALGEPIVMVTAYDHPSALIVEDAGVDVVLVGDSAANNVLGYRDTVPITMDELLVLARAVRRGLRTPLMVGDLPFGTYEASDQQAIETAHRFVKEAGCDAVKLEGGGQMAQRARAIVEAGTPVMGHVGLTPQTATALGGYRAQGRTAERARQVLEDALALQEAGCFSIVFEAIPNELTDLIMARMEIPVIGIGAGPSTDGQVLVYHDLLGIHDAFKPKFVKRYAELRGEMVDAVTAYAEEVRNRAFPGPEHAYGVAPEEMERLKEMVGGRAHA